jgi:NAD-dependent deacetylase
METKIFKIDPNYKIDTGELPIEISRGPKLVFFTGAGISVASDIPTYRNTNGSITNALWDNYDPIKCSHIKSIGTPEQIAFRDLMRKKLAEAKPNIAHYWISGLQRQLGSRVKIITTNVDDLHELSGSRNVNHLHGQISYLCCSKRPICDYKEFIGLGDHRWTSDLPVCPKCYIGVLRTDVVLFGERLGEEYQDAIELINHLGHEDIVISIGSSYSIFPFHHIIHASKATSINVTLDNDDDINSCFDYIIQKPIVECIEELDSIVKKYTI